MSTISGTINEPLPGSNEIVDRWRRFFGVVYTSSLSARLDPDTMARFDAAWDRIAGRYRLTAEEKWIRRNCRIKFGLYDPANSVQIEYIAWLQGLRDEQSRHYYKTNDRRGFFRRLGL